MSAIHIVACCHGMPPSELVDRLNKLGDRLGVEWFGLVIDNADDTRSLEGTSSKHRWQLRAGTNEDLDFSAYFEGATWLLDIDVADCVFVNDSLFRMHAATTNLRAVVNLLPLLRQISAPAIVGKTDRYQSMCLNSPWSGLGSYVSTYCFALNRASLEVFSRLRSLAAVDGLDKNIPLDDPTWGCGIATPFREFLRANLVYANSPYSWAGLKRHRIDDLMIRRKARCIYFEHRLSGEIGRIGCILPTNAGNKMRWIIFLHERLAALRSVISAFRVSP